MLERNTQNAYFVTWDVHWSKMSSAVERNQDEMWQNDEEGLILNCQVDNTVQYYSWGFATKVWLSTAGLRCVGQSEMRTASCDARASQWEAKDWSHDLSAVLYLNIRGEYNKYAYLYDLDISFKNLTE